jgi:type II secretory pathway pseudopilin PulG
MKLSRHSLRSPAGFSLVELMITMVSTVLVVGGVISAYMYGLRMTQFTKPKLEAADEARKAISLITDEIRSARNIKIGSGTINTFTEVAPFAPQVGSAIQLYPTTNTTTYIRYFWDSSEKKLKRTADGLSATYVIANSVSNEMVFRSEDHLGNLLSNNFNNRVISMTLNFYQIQYPVTPIGSGQYYDFYQLRTRITRRTVL